MKKLILVRHAKSDWPEETEDFDRPLADKGLEDAMNMSRFLKTNNIAIDYLVSSPAVRALNTCKIFNQTYQLNFMTDEKLYNPSERNFESVIYNLNDDHSSVAFFSHNNGISNFANSISEDIFHFPTCGVAGFEIDCNSWSEFDGASKKLLFFYEPNKIK
ncbi:phosphohistidine phosphatase [Chryseobacterium piperi]|uniref:Phosphohistidine phosphatase n=1 Tax=Chryseobacterium piperi TaxID=558152 RepID=A0A086BJG8_9FLAO|nr:histidine phosphatase family protein [Chryseobacterium piperi]ASW76456.1 phosphohistidine phosphatase [Chryseobacterium piperi]KFF29082.1 phosphohistidine phosphatase [Chryseobacterium piperi]